MKKFKIPNLNNPNYWNSHQTAFDFGLRQKKYFQLAGSGFNIIELGCGLSPFLKFADFKLKVGVDFSPDTIYKAEQMYPEVEYLISDCRHTHFRDKEFEVSVAGEVIEHLENPEKLIQEMVRITKKKVIISTPILEFKDPEHLFEYDEADLIKMLSPYGKVSCETIKSDRFKGRKYIFACLNLK